VGVDGGGTKTNAFVVDEKGELLGRATTPSTNPNSVGAETASNNLRNAIIGAVAAIGAKTESDPKELVINDSVKANLSRIKGIACGMAGCDTKADVDKMTGWVKSIFSTHKINADPTVQCFNDSVSALASGTMGKLYGIVLICGTGMISWGRNSDGSEGRAGGRGALMDGGSGYAIGLDVVRAVFESFDKLGPETALEAAVLKRLNLGHVEELVQWLYGDLSWARVADLARLAFELDEKGDKVAHQIVVRAADALAAVVKCVAKKIKFDEAKGPVPVVFAGSILQNKTIAALITENIKTVLPTTEVCYPKVDPAMGAALLAKNAYKPAGVF
jgi:N-acetylglucosamine kinase-like BadF-type ATPase